MHNECVWAGEADLHEVGDFLRGAALGSKTEKLYSGRYLLLSLQKKDVPAIT